MSKSRKIILDVVLIALGSIAFALGFDLFLVPQGINAGGLTGLAMIVVALTDHGSVGTLVILCNIPLFILGWRGVGRKFFFGSLLGMLLSNIAIDVVAVLLPPILVEPLLACLYGGALSGFGLGLVFARGASTGGVDIAARLVKQRLRSFSMGRVLLAIDLLIVALTGIAFRDLNRALYCAVTLYVSSIVLDSVVYGFDYSMVALIISDSYRQIAQAIDEKLDRGATLLRGEGAYTGREKQVILVAVRKGQLPELKQIVSEIDRDAFVIVQNAHQVQGEGFGRYAKDSL